MTKETEGGKGRGGRKRRVVTKETEGGEGRGGEKRGGEGWESGAVKLLQSALKCVQGTRDSASVLAKSVSVHTLHT